MSWFSSLFESVHSYNQRHLKHLDDCIAHGNKCIDNCRLDGDEDLIPKHEQSVKLWHEARALVASGQGELADGIKHAAWMLHNEASAVGLRRLQKRVREHGRQLRSQIEALDDNQLARRPAAPK